MPVVTRKKWKRIAQGFQRRWAFPHCLGSLDGKHIDIVCPAKTGSLYFNWKKRFSFVLMACVDADYKFTMIDVGACGSNNDAGIFSNCDFGKLLISNKLNTPEPETLDHCDWRPDVKLPYVFVGDEAFPLRYNLLRPFPGAKKRRLNLKDHLFNWRLSVARKVVENAFGILVQRFRIFHTKIALKPEHAVIAVTTCCMLHNYLVKDTHIERVVRDRSGNLTLPARMKDLKYMKGNHGSKAAEEVRDHFRSYFVSPEGELEDQIEKSNYYV